MTIIRTPFPRSQSKSPVCLPVACIYYGAFTGGNENDSAEYVAGLVIELTGDFAGEHRRLGMFRIAASMGFAWFGLGKGRRLWDVTMV